MNNPFDLSPTAEEVEVSIEEELVVEAKKDSFFADAVIDAEKSSTCAEAELAEKSDMAEMSNPFDQTPTTEEVEAPINEELVVEDEAEIEIVGVEEETPVAEAVNETEESPAVAEVEPIVETDLVESSNPFDQSSATEEVAPPVEAVQEVIISEEEPSVALEAATKQSAVVTSWQPPASSGKSKGKGKSKKKTSIFGSLFSK